jgi:hypothetical protein
LWLEGPTSDVNARSSLEHLLGPKHAFLDAIQLSPFLAKFASEHHCANPKAAILWEYVEANQLLALLESINERFNRFLLRDKDLVFPTRFSVSRYAAIPPEMDFGINLHFPGMSRFASSRHRH